MVEKNLIDAPIETSTHLIYVDEASDSQAHQLAGLQDDKHPYWNYTHYWRLYITSALIVQSHDDRGVHTLIVKGMLNA